MDDHADEMRKFRQEQKVKDQEHLETLEKLRKEHDQKVRDMNYDFESKYRSQDRKSFQDMEEQIRKYNELEILKNNELKT